MKVPKPLLIGLLFSAALFAGYQLNDALHSEAAAAAPVASASALEPEPKEPVVINLTLAGAGNDQTPGSVVNLTLNGQTAPTATGPGEARATVNASSADMGLGVDSAAPVRDITEPNWSGGASSTGRDRTRSAAGGVVTVPQTVRPTPTTVVSVTTNEAPTDRANVTVDAGDRGNTAQDFSITAIGNNIVIAYGDSVAFVGDHGALTANTGDASSSGTVALDVADSTLSSGRSASAASSTGSGIVGSPTTPTSATDGLDPNHSVPGRGLAISGYEDHSLNVAGSDHVVTYDDSNVFIARNGQINANTGDTDSAGLNVVDATGSIVRSGNQNEDAGADSEDSEDSDSDSEDAETPAFVHAINSADESSQTDDGDSDEPLGPLPDAPADSRVTVVPPRATAGVSEDEEGDGAGTTASGDQATVIGGDGYDNLAVDVTGQGHVVSYDDSNVVIGGEGGVNAQIGDSDTAGAVVMGVTNSIIEAGDAS